MINWQLIVKLLFYYLILNVFIFLISDLFMFPTSKKSNASVALPHEIQLETLNGKIISAIYLENPQAKYTILFSHGNAENLQLLLPYLETLAAKGFSVLAYDYHGYGNSQGRPTERNTYLDIQAAYDFLIRNKHIAPENIIVFGRSLGTGPTLWLAQKKPVAGVIIESPMLSAFRLVTGIPFFVLDKYRNDQKIQTISVPILIIHGSQDNIIPTWHGKKLYQLAQVTHYKDFFEVKGAHHNNVVIIGGENYWQKIVNFAEILKQQH